MAERPAERVPGAEPADDLDRHGRDDAALVDGRHEDAVAAELHDGDLDAAREERVRRGVGVGLPTAISHSARLPIAIVTASTVAPISRRASSSVAQNEGR